MSAKDRCPSCQSPVPLLVLDVATADGRQDCWDTYHEGVATFDATSSRPENDVAVSVSGREVAEADQ